MTYHTPCTDTFCSNFVEVPDDIYNAAQRGEFIDGSEDYFDMELDDNPADLHFICKRCVKEAARSSYLSSRLE